MNPFLALGTDRRLVGQQVATCARYRGSIRGTGSLVCSNLRSFAKRRFWQHGSTRRRSKSPARYT